MVLLHCSVLCLLLIVGSSHGVYMSVKKDLEEDRTAKTYVRQSYKIPDRQWSGYIDKNELICNYDSILDKPLAIEVELKEEIFPEVNVSLEPPQVIVYRNQNQGSVRLDVTLTCGLLDIPRSKRHIVDDVKPIAVLPVVPVYINDNQ